MIDKSKYLNVFLQHTIILMKFNEIVNNYENKKIRKVNLQNTD